MTDLEITKLCAEAMGLYPKTEYANGELYIGHEAKAYKYDPLTNDAQAMALVKKFKMHIEWMVEAEVWRVQACVGPLYPLCCNAELNRAICECVAYLQCNRY